MKTLHSLFISASAGVLSVTLPGVCFAADNWMGFIPPTVSVSNAKNIHHKNKWQKTTWRSGANFKVHDGSGFNNSSVNIVNAKEYALTQPQRKSVNPWHVDRSWSARKQFKFGPAVRPWGSVPQQFQKRSSNQALPQRYSQSVVNRNFMPPAPVYRPYVNNNVLNNSNSLLPVGAYTAFFPNRMFMNNQNLFTPPYGFSNAHLWR